MFGDCESENEKFVLIGTVRRFMGLRKASNKLCKLFHPKHNLNLTSVSVKGFMMELPVDFRHVKQNQIVDDGCLLFIPSKS